MSEKNFPPLIDQGKNFVRTAADVLKNSVTNKKLLVPDEVKLDRLKKCSKCDWFYKSAIKVEKDRCMACGCNLAFKTQFSSAECPKGKWGKWENK